MENTNTFVIHPYLKKTKYDKLLLLNEAVSLARAINLKCIFSDTVGLDKINSKTYLNSGYVELIKIKATELSVNLIFINTNLSPIQQRNLEKSLNCKIIDRTGLILEIFGSRAKSNEGKLSV